MRVIRTINRVSILVVVCLCLSCSPVEILIITDEFFDEFDWGLPSGSGGVVEILSENGFGYEIYSIDMGSRVPDLSKELSEKIGGVSILVLSPVLSYQGPDLAAEWPDRTIITVGRENYAERYTDVENLVSLYSDRTDAFREAGRLFGEYLLELIFSETVSEDEKREEILAEAYFYTGSRAARLEMTAFKEGLEPTSSSGSVEYTEVDTLTGRQNIKNRIDGSIKRKTPLLLFFLDELNAFCLESVHDENVAVVSDAVVSSGGYLDQILFSVEEMRRSALKDALSTQAEGGTQQGGVRSFEVEARIAIPRTSKFEEIVALCERKGVEYSVVDRETASRRGIVDRIEEFLGIR
jgi:hypothetical protein